MYMHMHMKGNKMYWKICGEPFTTPYLSESTSGAALRRHLVWKTGLLRFEGLVLPAPFSGTRGL